MVPGRFFIVNYLRGAYQNPLGKMACKMKMNGVELP
jgi:hypothetical protein